MMFFYLKSSLSLSNLIASEMRLFKANIAASEAYPSASWLSYCTCQAEFPQPVNPSHTP